MESLYLNHIGFKGFCKPRSGGANQKFSSFQIFRLAAGGLGGAAQKNERKLLGLPRATSGSASEARREIRKVSRFATGNMFGFHHIDGASQNKKPNRGRLRRQASENPRGFSTGFATKRQARDPAKAGSMFSEHSAHSCSEPIFFLLLSQKLEQ